MARLPPEIPRRFSLDRRLPWLGDFRSKLLLPRLDPRDQHPTVLGHLHPDLRPRRQARLLQPVAGKPASSSQSPASCSSGTWPRSWKACQPGQYSPEIVIFCALIASSLRLAYPRRSIRGPPFLQIDSMSSKSSTDA